MEDVGYLCLMFAFLGKKKYILYCDLTLFLGNSQVKLRLFYLFHIVEIKTQFLTHSS